MKGWLFLNVQVLLNAPPLEVVQLLLVVQLPYGDLKHVG